MLDLLFFSVIYIIAIYKLAVRSYLTIKYEENFVIHVCIIILSSKCYTAHNIFMSAKFSVIISCVGIFFYTTLQSIYTSIYTLRNLNSYIYKYMYICIGYLVIQFFSRALLHFHFGFLWVVGNADADKSFWLYDSILLIVTDKTSTTRTLTGRSAMRFSFFCKCFFGLL